jgi:hypothetical protein
MKGEKTNKEEITGQVKTTRGDILDFDRTTWNYMVKKLNIPETQLFKLRGARCPAKLNSMAADLLRFFNTENANEKGFTINDFESLNEHPELILYEGYSVRGKGGELSVKKFDGFETSILEEKIKRGEITEVGVVIEKTAAQKWLGRIGTFMMMGGFMLVLAVIVVLVVVISILLKNC